MLGRIIRGVVVALSGFIAIKIAEYFTKHTPEVGALYITLIAASTSTIFGVCADELIRFVQRRVQIVRKQLDPRSRFEGAWIFHAKEFPDRPIGYISIHYNAESDAYIYTGAAYNEQGQLGASWVCPKLDFDLGKNEVRFITESKLADSKAQGEISRSFGYINFEKNFYGWRMRYSRGQGFFCDYGNHFRKAHFVVDRLDPKRVYSLIGKREASSHDDISNLIRAIVSEQKATRPASDQKQPEPKKEI